MTKFGFELLGFTQENSDAVQSEISRIPELKNQKYTTSLRGATIGYFEIEEYNGDKQELLAKLSGALESCGVKVKGGEEVISLDVQRRAKDLFIDKR